RREREAAGRALQRRDTLLEGLAGRVSGARVLESGVLAHGGLRERRRQGDRRDDRAGARVGVLAGMDGTGLEAQPRSATLTAPRETRSATLAHASPALGAARRAARAPLTAPRETRSATLAHPGARAARKLSTSWRVTTPIG